MSLRRGGHGNERSLRAAVAQCLGCLGRRYRTLVLALSRTARPLSFHSLSRTRGLSPAPRWCSFALTNSPAFSDEYRRLRREYKGKRVHTCIYTHGHVDHVGGILDFEECATVKVVGHKNVKERFDRYKLTRGYNGHINTKQFNSRAVWPETYRYPDVYYEV